ncbi:hypothetical protein [Cochleicola gelatinilyticus]|uniref:Uncharacterized protein n=1 Tax=Cochleicola gelatinilyticus TaxID=1763537 RepID=A0A167HMJ1_9FLAO|nr:hypothetical protein [Cochleicola gelatinilyticus]OAB78772.1 hypothetical protein ULVI_09325 [Cochleicola gelatinilyticus]
MITIKKLNNLMYDVSIAIFGTKKIEFENEELAKMIKEDVLSYFWSMDKMNIAIDIEEISDERTNKKVYLLRCEALLVFNDGRDDDANTIGNYISNSFLNKLE